MAAIRLCSLLVPAVFCFFPVEFAPPLQIPEKREGLDLGRRKDLVIPTLT